MNSQKLELFNEQLADLAYAKDFKCPYVLFTSNGQAIGCGEGGFFMKTEVDRQRICSFRDIMIETKSIASYLKAVAFQLLEPNMADAYLFKKSPTSIFNVFGEIPTVMTPSYHETRLKGALLEAESFREVYTEDLSKDSPFMVELKSLKTDEGCVTLKINNKYIVMVHKKILSFKAAEQLSISILDEEAAPYYFARFETKGKGYCYNTYLRLLNVKL